MSSLYIPVGDAYDSILVKLGYPKSQNLRNIVEAALSEAEAAVWLGGPAAGITFSVTLAWKALEKCNAEPPPNSNYDLRYVVRQVKADGKHIVAGPCSCKVRARRSSGWCTWACHLTSSTSAPATRSAATSSRR